MSAVSRVLREQDEEIERLRAALREIEMQAIRGAMLGPEGRLGLLEEIRQAAIKARVSEELAHED
jgi:hypothetical protein